MRMRDLVAHHYGNLDYEIVWNTSVSDIPQLYHEIEEMLKTEQLAYRFIGEESKAKNQEKQKNGKYKQL